MPSASAGGWFWTLRGGIQMAVKKAAKKKAAKKKAAPKKKAAKKKK